MEPHIMASAGSDNLAGCRISFGPANALREPTADTRPHDPAELRRRLEAECATRPLALPTITAATMTRAERRAAVANNAPVNVPALPGAPGVPAGIATMTPPSPASPVTFGNTTTPTTAPNQMLTRAARRGATGPTPMIPRVRRTGLAGFAARSLAWLRNAPGVIAMIVRSVRGWLSSAVPNRRVTPRMVARPAAIFGAFVVLLTIGIPMGTKSALTPQAAPGASLVSAIGTTDDRDQITAASRAEVVRRSTSDDVQELEVSEATNSTVTLSWLNPALGDGESIEARRVVGTKAAKSLKAGEKVALPSASSTALLDSGLVAGKTYTYSLFLVSSDGSARLTSTVTAKTRKVSNTLSPGDILTAGQLLVGKANGYTLRMTAGGDVQLRDGRGNTLWSSDTHVAGSELRMLTNGNLAVMSGEQILWQTKTAGKPGSRLVLEPDGDIAIVAGGTKVWSRHDLGNMVQGDDYPWPNSYGISVLRYALRNCTDFVAWRLNEQAGVTGAPWRYTWANLTPGGGNARQWAQYYPNQTNETPKLGAVAWWSGSGSWGSSAGHVAIVSAIWPDGSITVEEYNVNPLAYGTRHLYPGTREWPEKFIHIHDL